MNNKKIIAACAAALGLVVVPGCRERSPTPAAPTGAATPPAVSVKPATPEPLPPMVELFDAGAQAPSEPQPVDELPLAHDDGRTVDHLSRAVSLREQGDFDGALAEARRALFDDAEDQEALEQIERCARLAGEHELRLNALDRLALMRPEDPKPLVQSARALVALKRYDEAIAAGKVAAQRDVFQPEVYQVLGRAYLGKGQLAHAIMHFEQVLAVQPEHGYALNNLGFAYLRANRNADAVEVLRRAVEVLPNVAYVHNNLGVALERVGLIDEAKAAYAEASFLSPRYLKAQLNASRIAKLAQAPATDAGALEGDLETALETSPASDE